MVDHITIYVYSLIDGQCGGNATGDVGPTESHRINPGIFHP